MIHREPKSTNRYGGWREDWLATTVEPVLEPALPIIDAHHHSWHLRDNRYLSRRAARAHAARQTSRPVT